MTQSQQSSSTPEEVFARLKKYCQETKHNLDLSPNPSEVEVVGFGINTGPRNEDTRWSESGHGWYEDNYSLPGSLLVHLRDDDDLLWACIHALNQHMS